MPLGYLVTAAVLAGAGLLAVAPPKPTRSSPSNLAYLLGFVVNELPYVAGAWLAVSTAIAAAQGDLLTPAGLAGLGLALVAAGTLVVIARRGLAARSAVAAALEGTLPVPDGATGPAVPTRHPWTRILLAPLPVRGREVRRVSNLSYGPAGRANLLDVYHHRTRRGGPILVYLHGGAFRSGHKNREAKPMLHRLAPRGWVCVSANYRLRPEARFPDQLIDAKRVIAWARRHAARYGGDGSRIWVGGSSAGGHLATTAALTPNDPGLQPGFAEDDTTVSGVISLYGFYGSPAAAPGVAASPFAYLPAASPPPAFLAHGDNDTIVLVDDARRFAHALGEASSSPVVYAELPGAQHGFDLFRSARFEAVVDAVEAFVTRARRPDRAGNSRWTGRPG
jgi:acetyl esterase/lipase